jgi:hypothetical protein
MLTFPFLSKNDTVKLGYKELNYNELLVIGNIFFSNFPVPNSLLTILSNPVITNPGHNKQIWLVPSMFVISKFDCIFLEDFCAPTTHLGFLTKQHVSLLTSKHCQDT